MKPVTDIAGERAPSHGRRRVLLAAAIALATFVLAGGNRLFALHRPEVMLLYVGAEDCAPCRAWHKGDREAFLTSAEHARITYHEIRSPHLADVLNDEYWPIDIRDYRSHIRRSDGVPLWLVIADRAVVEQQFGATAWQERILPTVRSYLR
jgi:hypothetical protein